MAPKQKFRKTCRGPCRKTHRIAHFRGAGKGGLSMVCIDCEDAGWKWCGWRKHVQRKENFYPGPGGRPYGYCKDCESARRIGTPRNEDQKGKLESVVTHKSRNRVTEYEKRKFYKALRETNNVAYASQLIGVSRDTGHRLKRTHQAELERRGHAPIAPDPRRPEQLDETSKKALDAFLLFARNYLGLEFDPWAEHAAQELLRAYHSDRDEYICLNASYGSGKSTFLTFAFVIWVVTRERAFGRESTISLGHRAEPKAKWYLNRIARELTQNRRLIEAYGRFKPETKGMPWSSTELMVEPLDWSALREKEPTLSVSSYEGAVMAGRFSLVIWDDLVDERNSNSPDQRERLVEWCDRTAETRLRTGGLFVLSGARFGAADLYANRLSQRYEDENGEQKPVYRRLIYKAHYEDLCDGDHRGPWPDGCLLSPRFVPWYRIQKAQINETRFRLSWQQEDVEPQGALAERAWFEGGKDSRGWVAPGCLDRLRFFGHKPPQGTPALSAITVDPSGSKFWGIIHWLVYDGGVQVVYQGLRRKIQAPDLLYREKDGSFSGVLENWWQAAEPNLKPRYVIVETRSQQRWLTQYEFVRTWAEMRGMVLLPHDTNRVNKHDPNRGVEMLKPVYREGRCRLPYGGLEERVFADAFIKEATSYPEGDTSDLLMSHWFLNHNLPQLLALSGDEEEEPMVVVPPWARTQQPPWAKEMVG